MGNRPIPPRGSAAVAVDKGPPITLVTLKRPPLAGPYAFSFIPAPVDNNPKIHILRNPPPTWIFSSVETEYCNSLFWLSELINPLFDDTRNQLIYSIALTVLPFSLIENGSQSSGLTSHV